MKKNIYIFFLMKTYIYLAISFVLIYQAFQNAIYIYPMPMWKGNYISTMKIRVWALRQASLTIGFVWYYVSKVSYSVMLWIWTVIFTMEDTMSYRGENLKAVCSRKNWSINAIKVCQTLVLKCVMYYRNKAVTSIMLYKR